MRFFLFLATFLFILGLPLLLLTSNLRWGVNSLPLYLYGFDRYQVAQKLGMERAELEKAARELIGYFNSPEERVHILVRAGGEEVELFNPREIIHLKDVKGLIRLNYRAQLAALAYSLGYVLIGFLWKGRRFVPGLGKALGAGGGLTLVLMLALALGILVDFDRLFSAFHLVSFANLFWVLDPARDRLIVMFPQGFFFQAALFIAGATILQALILGGMGWRIQKARV